MSQAIVTTFHGPTDTKGARYSARCEAGRVTVPIDHALSSEDNHFAVAAKLIQKLGWDTASWYGGSLPDGRHVFVQADQWTRARK
jgi:hypothetical protein